MPSPIVRNDQTASARHIGLTDSPPPTGRTLPGLFRGLTCSASHLVTPLGKLVPARKFSVTSSERLSAGLVIILPGIEGRSFLNLGILNGLLDAGVPYALEVYDWTSGLPFAGLWHLRDRARHRNEASRLASRIAAYETEYPGRPVWVIGHSGGGGIALLTLRALPRDVRVRGVVLIAAAIDPAFDLPSVEEHVETTIWNVSSFLDCLFVGIGTVIFGTIDGVHTISAGCCGFRKSATRKLREMPYRFGMFPSFHFAGHFGCVNRRFVERYIAPLLRDEEACREVTESRPMVGAPTEPVRG